MMDTEAVNRLSESSGWEPANEEWEDAELRAFMALSATEKFDLLMHAVEFLNLLRSPNPPVPFKPRS